MADQRNVDSADPLPNRASAMAVAERSPAKQRWAILSAAGCDVRLADSSMAADCR
jgi:hypothetical protein